MEFPDERYRDICDMRTLYSTEEGFLSEFFNILMQEIDSEWLNNVFIKQVSQAGKIRICCSDPQVWPLIYKIFKNITKVYRGKSSEAAQQSKINGDSLCKKGEYNRAVMVYSQSIIRAPLNRDQKSLDDYILPTAYKGRADALFSLGRYKECMNDLNMALKERFPDSLKYQIYRQMGKCYKIIGDIQKAKISFQLALKLLDEQLFVMETVPLKFGTEIDKSKDAAVKKVLKKERTEIDTLLAKVSSVNEEIEEKIQEFNFPYFGEPLPKITGTVNEKYPCASSLVKIRKSDEVGRFAAASQRIQTGTTLVVEEPQASFLLPKMQSSHCLHCFTRLFTPIPCDKCAGVAFCTVQCRDLAMKSYHKYECELLGLFMGSGMSMISYLSLRMVTQESYSFFKQLYSKLKLMETNGESFSFDEFTPKEKQYMTVYNLTTQSTLRTTEDYFKRTILAIFLVKCLKETEYFQSNSNTSDSGVFSEDEILAASIILHHLELLQFNAHEIYETRVSEPFKTEKSKAVYIAIGIYPTVALFNHECAPSVTSGKNIIIKTVRSLEKNDILSENYGPHYAKKSQMERNRELTSRYWFRCQCQACIEDWPKIQDLRDSDYKIRCSTLNCTGSLDQKKLKNHSEKNYLCLKCIKKINVQDIKKKKSEIDDLLDKSIELMNDGKCTSAVSLLTTYLDKIFNLISPPCREIFLAQEALRTCYAQTGNVWLLDK